MTDAEPVPIGEAMAARALSLRQPPLRQPPNDYEDPELDEARAHGIEAMRAIRWSSLIPDRFTWARIEDFIAPAEPYTADPATAASLRAWSDHPDGRNLLIFGPVGSSKTHSAVAGCRPRFDRGDDLAFWPMVELLDGLRPNGPDGLMEDVMAVDLLILDDLGTEKPSDWTAERVFAVLNRRWLERLPTVATTNLGPEALKVALGERAYSRLVGSGSVVLRLAGADKRRSLHDSPKGG